MRLRLPELEMSIPRSNTKTKERGNQNADTANQEKMVRHDFSGEKKEEYREIKPYWTTRFTKVFEFTDGIPTGKDTQEIILRNGYGTNAPYIKVLCSLQVKTGNPEWGAEPSVFYYTLKFHKITDINVR